MKAWRLIAPLVGRNVFPNKHYEIGVDYHGRRGSFSDSFYSAMVVLYTLSKTSVQVTWHRSSTIWN